MGGDELRVVLKDVEVKPMYGWELFEVVEVELGTLRNGVYFGHNLCIIVEKDVHIRM